MPSAITDTGPLHYLVLIDAIDLLPQLFARVFIPPEVRQELMAAAAPAIVRRWAATPPIWLSVSEAPADDDANLQALDIGERAVIALAATLPADLIHMDDRAGVTKRV